MPARETCIAPPPGARLWHSPWCDAGRNAIPSGPPTMQPLSAGVAAMRAVSKPASFVLALLLVAGLSVPALADPPDHAPAHGWRKKHDRGEREDRDDQGYEGYEGKRWDRDYAVLSGR